MGITAVQSDSNENQFDVEGDSIEGMLAKELSQVRKQGHKDTQNVISINTNVKGVVLIKITNDDICPVVLLKSIFGIYLNFYMLSVCY